MHGLEWVSAEQIDFSSFPNIRYSIVFQLVVNTSLLHTCSVSRATISASTWLFLPFVILLFVWCFLSFLWRDAI